MKIIISTGLGRLHLVQSAERLQNLGIDVEIIQGWVPRLLPEPAINLLGRLVNSKHLAAGMKKRQMPSFAHEKVHSCAFAEFFTQGLFMLNRAGWLERGKVAKLGWAVFGRCSRRYIQDQDVFHVRSGAGRGGAIEKAKTKGIKVLADHSIAHPAFMEHALSKDYERYNLPLSIRADDPFWYSIIEDCKESDLILVNSNFVKETFVEQGFAADRIVVAHQGVREDFFGLKTDYTAGQTLKLLFTGGFGIRKGAQYLLPALQHLVEGGMDVHLKVVGAYGEAKQVIDSFSLGERLTCTGFVPQDDLKEDLAKADIYIFPSLAEGCASSGMEAMAAGLPVIATRESGLPIRHGENGWIIPSKSDQAIVDAVGLLGINQGLRERLGREAAKTIAENYTWEHYARNVRDIYLSLLKE